MSRATITLKRSLVGKNPVHVKTVRALGLRRPGHARQVELNPAVKGMIKSVDYLLKIEDGK